MTFAEPAASWMSAQFANFVEMKLFIRFKEERLYQPNAFTRIFLKLLKTDFGET